MPIDAVLCRDANCRVHIHDVDVFYERIITNLNVLKRSVYHFKPPHSNFKAIPGWNDYVREHHAVAREALWWWKFYNKPRNGKIYHSMKAARARFKYALRANKRAEETAKADALANELHVCEKDNCGFWKDVSKINQSSNVIANCINGVSGESNISYFWKYHFSIILNSTGSCNDKLKNPIVVAVE